MSLEQCTYPTDDELRVKQKASGHFIDGNCSKCGAVFSINTRYPQEKCTALVEHKFCMGVIKHA